MAEIQENNNKEKKGNKQKKMNIRVDFTPMVDMNMLLITFFMLCTSLSKPQTMEISMPSNDKNITEEMQNKVKASQALTLLLGDNGKLYYYEGEPNYKDYNSLKETTYNSDGLRKLLLSKNSAAVKKVRELKDKKERLEISEEECRKEIAEVKSGRNTPTVIIKATDKSTYKNLIDALDEMQICSIGKYVIVDITDGDKFLIDNYLSKGELSQKATENNV
ncbi:ExbD/TolR family protein [Phocaeicola coprocola]|jgi:biopolymer transport protein ExbD|uniref:ExbD/TolR family protein n=1 Tax=Phocaeicola coprocola TaxID=310298 RepID=UPI00266ED6C0|nr:biopolymer transporter ExbD [Phocaeicola coprocola]